MFRCPICGGPLCTPSGRDHHCSHRALIKRERELRREEAALDDDEVPEEPTLNIEDLIDSLTGE